MGKSNRASSAPRLPPALPSKEFCESFACRDGVRFVRREQVYTYREDGTRAAPRYILYTAWEPSQPPGHGVIEFSSDGVGWGRVDTKRSPITRVKEGPEWLRQQGELIDAEMREQARARKLIQATCPETLHGLNGREGVTML